MAILLVSIDTDSLLEGWRVAVLVRLREDLCQPAWRIVLVVDDHDTVVDAPALAHVAVAVHGPQRGLVVLALQDLPQAFLGDHHIVFPCMCSRPELVCILRSSSSPRLS